MRDADATLAERLSLDRDEQVVLHTTPSENLLLAGLTIGFIVLSGTALVVGTVASLSTGRTVSLAVLVIVLVCLVAVYIVIARREYVLTTERACATVGLVSRRVSSVRLSEVRDVAITQSGWQGLLNLGTLRFETDDETVSLEFALVDDPASVYDRIVAAAAVGDEAATTDSIQHS